jgi:hypothetical protein
METSQAFYDTCSDVFFLFRHYVVSLPHKVDNMTYQDSFKAFTSHAITAMASGWSMNYGAQPISVAAVNASWNTPLNLLPVDQDCK